MHLCRNFVLSIFIFSLLLLSCVTEKKVTPPKEKAAVKKIINTPDWFLDTAPMDGNPVFSSFISRRYKRSEEKDKCLEAIAVQASIQNSVQASYKSLEVRDQSQRGFLENYNVVYDENLLASFAENIEILNELQNNEGTFVKAKVKGITLNSFLFVKKSEKNQPSWINTPPEIKDFFIGIGIAPRHRILEDSLKAADYNSILQIAKQKNIFIKSKKTDKIGNLSGTQISEATLEEVSGGINGFYVIDRFISQDGQYFYSLGICPKNLNTN